MSPVRYPHMGLPGRYMRAANFATMTATPPRRNSGSDTTASESGIFGTQLRPDGGAARISSNGRVRSRSRSIAPSMNAQSPSIISIPHHLRPNALRSRRDHSIQPQVPARLRGGTPVTPTNGLGIGPHENGTRSADRRQVYRNQDQPWILPLCRGSSGGLV